MSGMVMPGVVSRVVVCLLVLVALVGFTTRSSAQTEDPAKGAALLAEARKAIGGEDKLVAVKRLQVKGEMRRGQGNATLDGDSEVFLEVPDKFRRNESLSIGPGGPGIDRVEILNGNEVFDENSGGVGRFGRGGGDFGGGGGRRGGFGGGQSGDANQAAAQGIDPERLKELQLRNRRAEVSRLLLAFLLTTDGPVAWIGTAQSPEGTADVLEVKSTDGMATRLFLESTTHLPLMMTWSGGGQRGGRAGQGGGGGGQGRGGRGGDPQAQGGAPAAPPPAPPAPGAAAQGAATDTAQGRRGGRGFGGGAPATLEMHLSDYKVVNGIKLPHMVTRGANGQTAEEWTIKSYRINPTFKANTFTK